MPREKLTVRQAQARTGIAAADFSRIRQGDLKRFTLDRLMGVVNKLGSRVEMTLKFKPELYTPPTRAVRHCRQSSRRRHPAKQEAVEMSNRESSKPGRKLSLTQSQIVSTM